MCLLIRSGFDIANSLYYFSAQWFLSSSDGNNQLITPLSFSEP
jgi:hypothetical protein